MGFASPANDCVMSQHNPQNMLSNSDSWIIETADGHAVIEPVLKLNAGKELLILCKGQTQFARLQGKSLITSDGEVMESEAMKWVEVMNRV